MKTVNTRLHGLLDYTVAFMLMIPWMSDYYVRSQDTWLLALAGGIVVLYSLFTNYEFGFFKYISMKVHLVMDILVSVFLIGLPFLMPLDHYFLYWPVSLGAIFLVIVILSASKPYTVTHKDLDITRPA